MMLSYYTFLFDVNEADFQTHHAFLNALVGIDEGSALLQ